jgi:hypothetical protein
MLPLKLNNTFIENIGIFSVKDGFTVWIFDLFAGNFL